MSVGDEIPLPGGRVTPGVVRVGTTVRRPTGPHSPFVHELLRFLENVGFQGAPRLLGIDEQGREILTFIEGAVPRERPPLADNRLVSAARLIRRFHDVTAGSSLAGGAEVVCHHELGPHNTIYAGDNAVGLIDWDEAAPGSRLSDFANAIWCFVNVGFRGGTVASQARRIRLMCDVYGFDQPMAIVDSIEADLREALARHERAGRTPAERIFRDEVAWFEVQGEQLKAEL